MSTRTYFTSCMNVQVELEGLTGEVRFNDDGRRQNYTLHVVEMTVNSAMVKVSTYVQLCLNLHKKMCVFLINILVVRKFTKPGSISHNF